MAEDFLRKLFKCCLYLAMSVFVLCAAYATLGLVDDGAKYRERGCSLSNHDPLGLLTDPATGEVRAPIMVDRMKKRDFIDWFKTLPKAKRDAVKQEYLRIVTKYSE